MEGDFFVKIMKDLVIISILVMKLIVVIRVFALIPYLTSGVSFTASEPY